MISGQVSVHTKQRHKPRHELSYDTTTRVESSRVDTSTRPNTRNIVSSAAAGCDWVKKKGKERGSGLYLKKAGLASRNIVHLKKRSFYVVSTSAFIFFGFKQPVFWGERCVTSKKRAVKENK